MFEHLRPADSLSWTIAWQSSMFLALGLAAVVACRKRPARAHRALLVAMLAALTAPALTEVGRRLGWGLWNAPAAAPTVAKTLPDGPPSPRTAAISRPTPVPLVPPAPDRSRPIETSGVPATHGPIATLSAPVAFSWRSAFLAAWGVASLTLGLRLVVSFVQGVRMVGRGRVVDDAAMRAHVGDAAARLGLRIAPEVRRLSSVRCPAVWCWGREPVLLLPEGEGTSDQAIDWDGVFCHELAHWSRRDHLSTLAGEVLVCVLPWNPLAWLSRSRLADLAELACDDWVLASGLSAADYAESLLGLAPQRQSTPALAAVSSRHGLMNRIRHILAEGRRDPAPGARWTLAVCLTMLTAASALALAQARPASARPDDAKPKPAATPKVDQSKTKTLRGTVLGPDGKPLAGATVLWIGNRKPALSHVASPKGDEKKQDPEIIGKARSNDAGAFELSAAFNPADYLQEGGLSSFAVVAARGFGLASEPLQTKSLDDPLTLKVSEQVVIHGRLLTPGGMPAQGVRATFTGFYNDMTSKGMFVGYHDEHDALPEYWPRTQTTDAEGRFTIESVPPGMYVNLDFRHPDYAVDEVTVNTIPERTLSPSIRGFEIVPVEPTFTHTLEPARPVQGRVTDKESGKPLAGMLVEMIPMRRHGGQRFSTRTDADGRYRVSGHSTDGTYFTTVYPKADSGYLSSKELQNGWPAGAKHLEVNFALEKGRLIPGRVVDQNTKRGVAGAAVVYQPSRKNPNRGDHDLRNPVVTDADGRFKITGLPGEGFLAVETSSDQYIRTPVKIADRDERMHPQGFTTVDVPKEGEMKPVEVALRAGVSLEAFVVDPDGHPVDNVTAMHTGIDAALIDVWNQGHEFPEGKFRIPGADPERTYRVFFLKSDARLGAVTELKYDSTKNPQLVRLQPTATLRGKIATSGGEPPKGTQANVIMLLGKEKKEYTREELFNDNNVSFYANVLGQRNFYLHDGQPNEKGEFRFEAIIPGAGYYVSGGGGNREFRVPVWDLKPGEVRDLGVVKLEESPR
ncbi:MAG: carboxypeptidase regulatory-like domain-containing protein [Paludisphaera borealis]|uniref:carboxypeptidase regulatory-like domain-containing protein n=1 Tax=Paludisphaera borealis TaxID=1387353 RepID=UPI0028460BAB|nr:carboxypeptidase regulatory-like domain-containing protein [Paludisphaera borealis]MDR3620022.1 carboxypeptidase regulatory-like domain-containing protein [Paludisphaera borealis]